MKFKFLKVTIVGLILSVSNIANAGLIELGAVEDAWLSDTNSDGIIDTLNPSAINDAFLRTFGFGIYTRSVLKWPPSLTQ